MEWPLVKAKTHTRNSKNKLQIYYHTIRNTGNQDQPTKPTTMDKSNFRS
jgi:hypothetical protein